MTVISQAKERMNEMRASQSDLDVSMWEGVGAAASDAWNTGPTAALSRAAKSIFDTSETIDADKANEMFGLGGTDAAITEPITIDAARAKADDYQRIRLNDIITSTVNEDAPIMGRVAQFGASLGASMVDPVLLAANIGGAAAIGAGVRTFTANAAVQGTKSARMFTGIYNHTPGLAKAIVTSYGDDITRSWMTIMAREGAENLAGGIAEEAIIQGALTIGDERMAQKYGIKDSMQNLVAGVLVGSGFTSVVNKEARRAFSNKLLMDWGDDAPDFFKANTLMGGLESMQGHEKGRLEIDLQNMERFQSRPWYGEIDTDNTKMFVPVNKNGEVHTVSHRGNGPVFTTSKAHAFNSGEMIIEFDTKNLNIATDDALKGTVGGQNILKSLLRNFVQDVVYSANKGKLNQALAMIMAPDVDLGRVRPSSQKELVDALSTLLEGKNVSEMHETILDITSKAGFNYDPSTRVDEVLTNNGFDGYRFQGKDFDGKKGAFEGVYVSSQSAQKVKKLGETATPQPTQFQKSEWLLQQEQVFKKHADWVKHKAKSLKADPNDVREAVGLPRETALDETAAPKSKDHIQEALASTKEKVGSLEKVLTKVAAKFEKLKTEGKALDDDMLDLEETVALAQKIKDGADYDALTKESQEGFGAFVACALKGFFG